MKKRFQSSGQGQVAHGGSSVDKEKEVLREREEEQEHRRRAEKKLMAFWMSLSYRRWTLFKPCERPSFFQHSTSSAEV